MRLSRPLVDATPGELMDASSKNQRAAATLVGNPYEVLRTGAERKGRAEPWKATPGPTPVVCRRPSCLVDADPRHHCTSDTPATEPSIASMYVRVHAACTVATTPAANTTHRHVGRFADPHQATAERAKAKVPTVPQLLPCRDDITDAWMSVPNTSACWRRCPITHDGKWVTEPPLRNCSDR